MDLEDIGEEKTYSCSNCNKEFQTLILFNRHKKTHNLTCEKCNKTYKTFSQLRQHNKQKHPKLKFYKCKVCPDLTFNVEKEFLLHLRNAHEGKIIESHMCNVCGKTFRTSSELTLHIRSKCGTEKQFICKECGQRLMSPGSLYTHLKRHKGENSFMCRFCAKLFLTSGQLKVHERIHTQQKVFVCDVCGKGFCHRQSLITHISVHTGIKPYQCEGCGKSFSCVGNLLKHRRTHSDTCGAIPMTSHRVQNPSTKIKVRINTPASSKLKRMQMKKELEQKFATLDKENSKDIKNENVKSENKECSTEEASKLKLKEDNYMEEEEEEEDSDYIPDGDNTSESSPEITVNEEKNDLFKDQKQASRPKRRTISVQDEEFEEFLKIRKLSKGKTATCKYCKKEYSNFKWLFKHEQEHMDFDVKDEELVLYKCSVCRKGFETDFKLKEHQEEEHVRELTCPKCNKIFSSTKSCRTHQKNFHEGVKRKKYLYVCDKCGRQFKQNMLLTNHKLSNCNLVSQFKCQICFKEFSSIYSQKAHLQVHVNNKTFDCGFCGKKYRWKGQLKIHLLTHVGQKPYSCKYCPKKFIYRNSLLTHHSVHSGVKMFFCKCCGRRFSCIGNLIKHKVRHASSCGKWYKENALNFIK